jgi:ABC-type transporter Mla subunit MlaD
MSFDININLRLIDAPGAIGASLDQIFAQLEALMATVNSVKQLVSDLNDETNAVAAKVDAQTAAIADLKAKIAAGSPATQEDLDAIAAGLVPISERLKALGADPTEPIPPAPAA